MVRELTTKPFLRAAQGVAIFLTSVSEKTTVSDCVFAGSVSL
jgi:hypothetical protein